MWSARLREHAASSPTICSWYALEGVKEATFHYWRKRLSGSVSPAAQLNTLPFPGKPNAPMLEL